MSSLSSVSVGVRVLGSIHAGYAAILTPEALEFLASLHRAFDHRRLSLLAQRDIRQTDIDAGKMPQFRSETANIRESDWRGPSIPADLVDRRVEITGPVSRKMLINALNSGACVFMADFEDATSPTWTNLIEGQINLYDAVRRNITFNDSKSGQRYKLKDKVATLMVRPRGWHLSEAHLLVDNQRMSASLFDFGLYFFHNARELLARGSGPYFYLPKMEYWLEAKLWADVFSFSEHYLSIPRGSVRATVLIETILAAFEIDEILYALKDYSAGANCGRWDYLFSFIKKFNQQQSLILPERSLVTMRAPFMDAYVRRLVEICHRRGVHAMGGMAAQIPISNDKAANDAAMRKVLEDKQREVSNGHDGTWIAHPALLPVAMEAFKSINKNQLSQPIIAANVSSEDLVSLNGLAQTITPDAIHSNIRVCLGYTSAWLRGVGCLPINHLMEDAATAEICRAQLWSWQRHQCSDSEGRAITFPRIVAAIHEVTSDLQRSMTAAQWLSGQWPVAVALLVTMTGETKFEPFLTTRAYEFIIEPKAKYNDSVDGIHTPSSQRAKL